MPTPSRIRSRGQDSRANRSNLQPRLKVAAKRRQQVRLQAEIKLHLDPRQRRVSRKELGLQPIHPPVFLHQRAFLEHPTRQPLETGRFPGQVERTGRAVGVANHSGPIEVPRTLGRCQFPELSRVLKPIQEGQVGSFAEFAHQQRALASRQSADRRADDREFGTVAIDPRSQQIPRIGQKVFGVVVRI